ncbi:MAG: sel1 repeat family protein [Myxococcales bacterium]|nr:sel1 repeat family protein [Myxococcales bacterium]MCB9532057.1 sel1 repeat family protein [Myxococcales bacterium]
MNVGGALAEGSGVDLDVSAGVALAERGCDQGALLGCVSAARFADAPHAVELLRRACDGGFAGGCVPLGDRLAGGAPVDALAAWSRGCDGGIVSGCYAVGMAYLRGVGVDASEARAAELLSSACGHGSSEACRERGRIAWASVDPEERHRALPLLQRACGGLDGEACALSAEVMSANAGDPIEAAAAPSFLRRACELGWVAACDAPR